MFASYKVTRTVNLPDQVGVNAKEKILMLDCEKKHDDAWPGSLLATYRGELADKYKLEVAIIVEDLDKFLVLVRDSDTSEEYWNDDYDEDDDEDEYREEDDEIFCKEADDENLLTVLGEAFATVEKTIKPVENTSSKVDERPKTSGSSTDDFLRKLRNAINSIIDE